MIDIEKISGVNQEFIFFKDGTRKQSEYTDVFEVYKTSKLKAETYYSLCDYLSNGIGRKHTLNGLWQKSLLDDERETKRIDAEFIEQRMHECLNRAIGVYDAIEEIHNLWRRYEDLRLQADRALRILRITELPVNNKI